MNKLQFNWPLILFAVFILGPMFGRFLLPIMIIAGAIFFIKQKFPDLFQNNLEKIKNNTQNNMNNSRQTIDISLDGMKNKAKIIAAMVVGAALLASSIKIVEAGNTGVYSLFGKVKDTELSSGLHFINPFARVTPMSVRTSEYTMSVAQNEGRKDSADTITSLTKEGLNVDLDITVLYHLNEESASDIYRNLGLGYEATIIRPEIRNAIREVIALYEAKDIYSEKRGEASSKIKDLLASKLDPRGIAIEDVLLRNVTLPANLAEAIEAKLQAEQEAQRYDFVLDREKKEKERKIIEAEGQMESQKIITESLTTNYLYYLYVTGLKEREGTIYVPTSGSTGLPLFKGIGN